MKIGIDASLVVGDRAGVGYYTASLIEALASVDSQNEYVLYPFFYHIFDPRFKELASPAKNFSVRFRSLPEPWVRYLWFRSRVPKHWLLGTVDVLHSTTYCCPRAHSGKLVVTIYDISFLRFPEHHTEANRLHCVRGTLDAAQMADRIIAISENTRKDLIEYFNIDDDRIVVIPLAARKGFAPRPAEEVQVYVSRWWGLSSPYLLSVGTLEPRKNMKRLIQAYCDLPRELRDRYSLVIAGGKGWLSSDLYHHVLETGVQDRIRFLGYVPEGDLPWLYCGASCFLYPSLYEGFGLPTLEAMACGVPVVASNTSSLPEVVGDAAILVDPQSERDIGQAMIKVLSDVQLRGLMSAKGVSRAAGFSWEKVALDTLRVYESCHRI